MNHQITEDLTLLTIFAMHISVLVILLHNQSHCLQTTGMLVAQKSNSSATVKKRRFWMLQRSTDWWDTVVKNFDDSDWLRHFRIRKSTFEQLVALLSEDLKPDDRSVRAPISLEKRIAVAIYKLASAAEFRVVGVTFGIHKTSVHRCLHRFCQALCRKHKEFIHLPDSNEAQQIANQNHQKSGFPQVFGAIDGCHIHVKAPKNGMRDYINRKRFPSLVLQAVVDNQYRFRDVSVKMPGSAHDASVLRASHLYENAANLPKGTITINDVQIPLMIVGDSAYPLLPWLMRPYTGFNLTERQETFNYHHSSVRIVVENAFGRLKARWRILKRQLDVDIQQAPFVIAACCIMHNICEQAQIPVPRDTETTLTYGSTSQPDAVVDSHIRSAIADYLCEI